jgi:four helix bundle protein
MMWGNIRTDTQIVPAKITRFYHLDGWQQGRRLALDIYKLTGRFPEHEKFGMISQLRRVASSVTANIAEGFARYHYKDKVRFYHQARGSTAEVQNFLLLAKDLNIIDRAVCKKFVKKLTPSPA